jgi:hypothetical protein
MTAKGLLGHRDSPQRMRDYCAALKLNLAAGDHTQVAVLLLLECERLTTKRIQVYRVSHAVSVLLAAVCTTACSCA